MPWKWTLIRTEPLGRASGRIPLRRRIRWPRASRAAACLRVSVLGSAHLLVPFITLAFAEPAQKSRPVRFRATLADAIGAVVLPSTASVAAIAKPPRKNRFMLLLSARPEPIGSYGLPPSVGALNAVTVYPQTPSISVNRAEWPGHSRRMRWSARGR